MKSVLGFPLAQPDTALTCILDVSDRRSLKEMAFCQSPVMTIYGFVTGEVKDEAEAEGMVGSGYIGSDRIGSDRIGFGRSAHEVEQPSSPSFPPFSQLIIKQTLSRPHHATSHHPTTPLLFTCAPPWTDPPSPSCSRP
jgi:hypothetical protein